MKAMKFIMMPVMKILQKQHRKWLICLHCAMRHLGMHYPAVAAVELQHQEQTLMEARRCKREILLRLETQTIQVTAYTMLHRVHGGIQKEKIQLISVGAPVLTATH